MVKLGSAGSISHLTDERLLCGKRVLGPREWKMNQKDTPLPS